MKVNDDTLVAFALGIVSVFIIGAILTMLYFALSALPIWAVGAIIASLTIGIIGVTGIIIGVYLSRKQ